MSDAVKHNNHMRPFKDPIDAPANKMRTVDEIRECLREYLRKHPMALNKLAKLVGTANTMPLEKVLFTGDRITFKTLLRLNNFLDSVEKRTFRC